MIICFLYLRLISLSARPLFLSLIKQFLSCYYWTNSIDVSISTSWPTEHNWIFFPVLLIFTVSNFLLSFQLCQYHHCSPSCILWYVHNFVLFSLVIQGFVLYDQYVASTSIMVSDTLTAYSSFSSIPCIC